MEGKPDRVIWIEVDSPKMLLGDLNTESMFGSDHFIQFNLKTKEQIFLAETKFKEMLEEIAIIEEINVMDRSSEEKSQLRTLKRKSLQLQEEFPYLVIPKNKAETPQKPADMREKPNEKEEKDVSSDEIEKTEQLNSEDEEPKLEPGSDDENEEEDLKVIKDEPESSNDESELPVKSIKVKPDMYEDIKCDNDGFDDDGIENRENTKLSEKLIEETIDLSKEVKEDEEDDNYSPFGKKKIKRDHSKRDPSLKCERCRRTFVLVKSFQKHVKLAKCIVKGDDYVCPSKRPDAYACMCPQCGQSFTHISSLRSHVKSVHLKQKDFHCDQCDKSFVEITNLRSHIETKHLKLTVFCEFCPKQFTATAYLKDHVRRQHSDTTVSCPNCHKNFIQQKNLDIHLLNGICNVERVECMKERKKNTRPWKCPYCPKAMENESRYKRHVNNIHLKGTGMSPKGKSHRCCHCEFHTPFKKRLVKHMGEMHPTLYNPFEDSACGEKNVEDRSFNPYVKIPPDKNTKGEIGENSPSLPNDVMKSQSKPSSNLSITGCKLEFNRNFTQL